MVLQCHKTFLRLFRNGPVHPPTKCRGLTAKMHLRTLLAGPKWGRRHSFLPRWLEIFLQSKNKVSGWPDEGQCVEIFPLDVKRFASRFASTIDLFVKISTLWADAITSALLPPDEFRCICQIWSPIAVESDRNLSSIMLSLPPVTELPRFFISSGKSASPLLSARTPRDGSAGQLT